MPRPREFAPEEALEKAMRVFWQKGYANTSVEDLVGATGVNRYGLYDEFESKRGLFLAALDHYQDLITSKLFAPVEQAGASIGEIRRFFEILLHALCSEAGRIGCLMATSAAEVGPFDKKAAAKIDRFRRRLQRGFTGALSNAKARGEIAGDYDPEAGADFLIGVMHGLSTLARSQASAAMLRNVVAMSLSCLR